MHANIKARAAYGEEERFSDFQRGELCRLRVASWYLETLVDVLLALSSI